MGRVVSIQRGLKIRSRMPPKSATMEVRKMAPDANEREPDQPDNLPLADYREVLAALPNAELLSALDLTLLELERRLYRYAHVGPELLEMANEGLVLAVRARARKLDFSSSFSSVIGSRNETRAITGIGSNVPLGMMRLRFSR